jgi:hypothetical protein
VSRADAEELVADGVPEGIPLQIDHKLVGEVDFKKGDGLVMAVVQDVTDGTVLMVGYIGSTAGAARSTGARARPRGTASTCARCASTATGTRCWC